MGEQQARDREIRLLLDEMTQRGWTLYEWGPTSETEPQVRGAAYFWDDGAADVVLVRGETGGAAYRTPACRDVFVPECVTEFAIATPVHVLRAALTWDAYGQERVPRPLVSPPPGCGLPRAYRNRVTESVRTPNNPRLMVRPPFPTSQAQ